MYYILDQDEDIIGILRNEGNSCPYLEDIQTVKIAESNDKIWSDSLTLKVPYGYDETQMLEPGNKIMMREENDHWKLYTIYETSEEIVGMTHHKSVECFNTCIWNMAHRQIDEKTWSIANTAEIAPYIFANTGYRILDASDFYFGATKTYTVASGTRQSAADEFIKEFDIEVEAYCIVNNGNIIDKVIEFSEQMGEETGQRFEYRRSLKGAKRIKTNSEFFTKLYVYGGTNSKDKVSTITSVNKVKDPDTGLYSYLPFLVDDDANDKYNNGDTYLEGVISNESIVNPNGLLDWGKKQMEYYNHPKYDYEVEVALLDEYPMLGDLIAVVDFEMEPELTITARVLETNFSKSDPTKDTVVLGEFTTLTTVTPDLIWQLQAKAQSMINELQNKKTYRVEILTPDGTDFSDETSTKRLIAQVYEDNTNITGRLTNESFIWEKIDNNGIHDDDWEDEMVGAGSQIEIGFIEDKFTVRCRVINILSNVTYGIDEVQSYLFSRLLTESLPSDDANLRTAQYMHYDEVNKHCYWSQIYTGSSVNSSDGSATKGNSFSITKTTKEGKYIDRIVVYWGGHGSHFGFEIVNGEPYIYTPIKDWTTGRWYTVKFKYVAGQTIKHNSGSIVEKVHAPQYKYERFNVDTRNGYVITSSGVGSDVKFKIGLKSKFDGRSTMVTKYTLNSSAYGIRKTQVYQSVCLDFPNMYLFYGGSESSLDAATYDWPTLYCINVVTGELIFKHIFTFDGNIQPIDVKHEAETINYYYDPDTGKRKLLIGFAFDHEDTDWARAGNFIYEVPEQTYTTEGE